MSVSVAAQVDYQKSEYSYPNYVLSKIAPIEGTQTRTITAAGGDVLTFELPPNSVYNLAKSYITLTANPPAVGGAYNWIPVDVMSAIREIVIQTKGGLQLAYIPNFDVYTKAVLKHDTKFEDMLVGDDNPSASWNGLTRCDVAAAANNRYNATFGTVSFTEPLYTQRGGLAAAGPLIPYKFPLSIITNSIFSVDKDLVFNETLQIKITINSANRLGWSSTGANDPTAGALAIVQYTLTNPFLYLAIEKNESVSMALKSKVASAEGLSLLMDYVYVNKTAFAASTQQQMQLRFNRANGLFLKKIFYCLTPLSETTFNSFEITNVNGAKVTSFYTMLNNIRRLDFNVSCVTADLEDWIVMRDKLKGSCIQNSDMFQYNWVYQENFDDALSLRNQPKQPLDINNLKQGLDLNIEQKFDFVGTTVNAGFNHYAFSVCQKMLVINQNGVQIL